MNRLVLLLWLSACHVADPPAPDLARAELATIAVELRRPTGTLSLAGELRPWQQVELRARLPAHVKERRVEVGDRVTAGMTLLELSAPDRVAERAEAEAELGAAEARLRRLESASSVAGTVAPGELDEARGASASLEARVRALRELERELTVRAPFSGVVTARGADTGALVGPGSSTSLVSLADTSRLRLVVAVPEQLTAAAAVGSVIGFYVEGLDATPREATVSRTSGLLDPATRTLHVELDVDNADASLLAGRYVQVRWPLDPGADQLWVPDTAIVRSTEGTWVWVRRGDQLVRVMVEELLREDKLVSVRAELSEGELVVVRGSEDFVEGAWPGAGG